LVFPDIHTIGFRDKQNGYHFVFQAIRFIIKPKKQQNSISNSKYIFTSMVCQGHQKPAQLPSFLN